jgi:hypothetical protein
MCYFCHTSQNNPSAPAHRSARCRDKANTYSQVPMDKRRYDHGQPIVGPQFLIVQTATSYTGK